MIIVIILIIVSLDYVVKGKNISDVAIDHSFGPKGWNKYLGLLILHYLAWWFLLFKGLTVIAKINLKYNQTSLIQTPKGQN